MIRLLVLLALLEAPIPLAPGNWWVYRESYTVPSGPLDITEDATTRFRVHRWRGGLFITQTGGADPVSGPVELTDSGIVLPPWTGEDRLPLPLLVGRAGAVVSEGLQGWTVEAAEEVTVPAGRFQALRCALRTPRLASVLWIAPGVGVVRETHGSRRRPGRRPEIERVLLRWHARPADVGRGAAKASGEPTGESG